MVVAALTTDFLDLQGDQSNRLGARDRNAQGRTDQNRTDQNQNGVQGAQSRLRTRTMGLRLGPLGLTYTDRDLELHPGDVTDLAQEARSTAKPASFLSPSDIQRLGQRVNQSLSASSASRSTAGRSASRRVAAAYALVASGQNAGPRRSLLGVV